MPNILEWDHAAPNVSGGSLPELTKPGIHSYNSRRRTDSSIENIPMRSPFPWIRTLSLFVGLAGIGYYAFTLADDFVYQRYQNWAFTSIWLTGTRFSVVADGNDAAGGFRPQGTSDG